MSKVYILRLAEEMAVVFLTASLPVLVIAGGVNRAIFVGAAGAGLRAVYAALVAKIGERLRPSAK